MSVNIGTADRVVRLVLGLALIVAALASGLPLFAEPLIRYVAVAVGAVLAVTAVVRFCPLYRIFGIRTCRV